MVIRLHRLALEPQPFHLNPDLVLTVEAHPDTLVVLTTGSRLLVKETPEQVAEAVAELAAPAAAYTTGTILTVDGGKGARGA